MFGLYNARLELDHYEGLTPFDTNWKKGSCATTLTTRDLFLEKQSGSPTSLPKVLLSLLPLNPPHRGETQRRQHAAKRAWRPSDLPEWLNETTYRDKILPRLAEITVPTIATALGISEPYATNIRAGRRCPHPRHWNTLAQLAGVPRANISRES